MAWPAVPPSWLEDYCVWRINSGKPDDRPTTVPILVPEYANEVLYWCIWRRKGRPAPRPTSFPGPAGIEKWAYAILDGVNSRAPIQIPGDDICPHSWVLPWAIWRFKGEPDPIPPAVPKDPSYVAPYIWSFLNWAAWQRRRFGNPTAPRPKNIPSTIPSWCWKHLKAINIAVPLGPPPPPPPPPGPPKPANTWACPFPFMTTAWGPLSDSQYRDNDEAYRRMRNANVKTVGFQVAGGEPLFTMNAVQRARALGLKIVIWGVAHPRDNEILALTQADGYAPQVETPEEYAKAMANFQASYGEGISRSVYTTLYGFNTFTRRAPTELYPQGQLTTVEYEAMRPYCTHALVECYVQDGGAHYPIINMMFAAGQRGFDYFNPSIGLYHETPLSIYRPATDPDTLDSYGREIGVYLSEGMTPGNWAELAALGTTAARTVEATEGKGWLRRLLGL